ncbi:M20 family peptidase [Clostridium sp. 'White wine YQ']|uniref:M20 family peptidase n=1 Tax=Clostridium sp. 'White wine YQ' TaxID=3027474 RepID=UPI002365B175|nr:M20 family peptidase [Clostridium sp. 'White wine YQ']MDD7796383.1 M20 family peptidase [Clostridium sp. 'White wine YQ']
MNQELISYLSTCRKELFSLCKFLYDNPEESYKEVKACSYITNYLKEKGFYVNNNFLGIKTSFIAEVGSGHPKICFLCEYDAIADSGHVTGHNLLTTISIASSIALAKLSDKFKGSIVLIGCPGEYLGGTKTTMVRQGIFDDIDIVMQCHPNTITAESGTSSAIIPLKVNYKGNAGLSFLNKGVYNSLDATLLTFNILNSLMKGFPDNLEINSILSKGGLTPLLLPTDSEAKFYIRAKEMEYAKFAESKLREVCSFVSNILNINYSISFYEPPNEELLTNITLNRLYSHNLKEAGIIDIAPPKESNAGLSLGCVSQKVPTIQPYIDITNGQNINYGSVEFAKATLSDFAIDNAIKASQALCFTALDVLQNPQLLSEVKSEFFSFNKGLY